MFIVVIFVVVFLWLCLLEVFDIVRGGELKIEDWMRGVCFLVDCVFVWFVVLDVLEYCFSLLSEDL